jgi:hypothetical protein
MVLFVFMLVTTETIGKTYHVGGLNTQPICYTLGCIAEMVIGLCIVMGTTGEIFNVRLNSTNLKGRSNEYLCTE